VNTARYRKISALDGVFGTDILDTFTLILCISVPSNAGGVPLEIRVMVAVDPLERGGGHPAASAIPTPSCISVSGAVSAAPGGFAFTADISSAQSGSLTAGLYLAHLEITKAADVRVVDLGQITVGAHPAPA